MSTTPVLDYSGAIPKTTIIFASRFDINSRTELKAVDTLPLYIGTVFDIVTGSGSTRLSARIELESGPADAGDPSQITPDDYNVGTNDKHWLVIGGFLPEGA
jgi:hypothetical protein